MVSASGSIEGPRRVGGEVVGAVGECAARRPEVVVRIDDDRLGIDDVLDDLARPLRRAGLHRSAFRLETAECALEEQQGERAAAVVVGVGLECDDPTQHEVVVAHLVHLFDGAVDPGDGAVDDR